MFIKDHLPLLVVPVLITLLSVFIVTSEGAQYEEQPSSPDAVLVEPMPEEIQPETVPTIVLETVPADVDVAKEAPSLEETEVIIETESIAEIEIPASESVEETSAMDALADVDMTKTTFTEEEVLKMARVCHEEFGIDPYLLTSMAFQESTYRSSVENGGCYGLIQINPRWQKERMARLGVSSLTEPLGNLRVGSEYFMELLNDNGGDTVKALKRYHGEVKSKSNYAYNIINRADEFRAKYEK